MKKFAIQNVKKAILLERGLLCPLPSHDDRHARDSRLAEYQVLALTRSA